MTLILEVEFMSSMKSLKIKIYSIKLGYTHLALF